MDQTTGRRKQDKGRSDRSTLTIDGRVSLHRRRYHSRGEGSTTPGDDWLDAAHATISLATRDLCCQLNMASRSFEMTACNVMKSARLSLSAETLRQLVEEQGKSALEQSRTGELGPAWRAAQCKRPDGQSLVYLSSDGFMAPMITDQEKQTRREKVMAKRKTRKGGKRRLSSVKRGSDQRYKEFKEVMFYDHDLEHRQVSVTCGDCHSAGKLMTRDAWRLGFAAADFRVGNIDGGPWIINQIHARKLPMTATGLDFYHLGENVHKARRIVFGEEDAKGKRMADDLMHTVKHEGYEPMRQKLMEIRQTTRGARRKAVDRLIEYVSDRREMIRYPEFIKNGWHIGSGAMESQCRVVPDRVKGPGKRWDADNAESIMALEAIYQSGQATAYWNLAMSGRN